MQKHQQLQRALNKVLGAEPQEVQAFNDHSIQSLIPYREISLELIIAALEKKGYWEISFVKTHNLICFADGTDVIEIPFTPLQPLPQESVEKLLEIFK